MYQSSLFPLRSIVGDAVPLDSPPLKVFESTESKALEISYSSRFNPSKTHPDPKYTNYLSLFDIDGTVVSPGEGMDDLPMPPQIRPFGANNLVFAFFALSKKKKTADV